MFFLTALLQNTPILVAPRISCNAISTKIRRKKGVDRCCFHFQFYDLTIENKNEFLAIEKGQFRIACKLLSVNCNRIWFVEWMRYGAKDDEDDEYKMHKYR